MAYCKSFRIDNSGLSQVKSHEKCHKPGQILSNQRTFEIGQKGQISLSKISLVFTPEDPVAKAEILQALHTVNKNLLFAPLKEDSQRICPMFPDSMIAKSYSMADTKSQYMIKFGIADYLVKKLIYDVNRVLFSFLFDESTNKLKNHTMCMFHIGHQGMIKLFLLILVHCCWFIVACYNGDDLVEHYNHFVDKIQLKSGYLQHLGPTAGPNVNLSFENELESNLESINTSFLRTGTSSLHLPILLFEKVSRVFIRILSTYQGKRNQHLILMTFSMIYIFSLNCLLQGERTKLLLKLLPYLV